MKKIIKTLENRNKGKGYVCEHVFPELTALCPTSGLPDFYTARIVYEPRRKLVELKSLKLYYVSFRNMGLYHEEVANKILEDFISAVEPRWVFLELRVNVRGGIETVIKRFWGKAKSDDVERALGIVKDEDKSI